jgi:pimeloyl-ACP methyl ester carboxylesterase
MPIVEHGSLHIDLSDTGRGPPVLLAHSSVAGNRQWRRLAEQLSDRYRVLAPNLLGYGQTTPWPAERPQTVADAAQVLLALCDGLDGPIRLVGHSWGAALALHAAHRLGDRVSHLLLYEPMLAGLLHSPPVHAAWAEAQALHADVRRLGGAGDWLALAARFTDYFNGDGAWAATPVERRQAIAAALPPNFHEWEAAVPAIAPSDFSGVRARVLLLQGGATRPVLAATAERLLGAFPHWAFERLPGWGHMGPLTHAEAFNRRVDTFLA